MNKDVSGWLHAAKEHVYDEISTVKNQSRSCYAIANVLMALVYAVAELTDEIKLTRKENACNKK